MRQLCNIAYMAQVEAHSYEAGALDRWEAELNRPPAGLLGRSRPRSVVTAELENLMPTIGPGA